MSLLCQNRGTPFLFLRDLSSVLSKVGNTVTFNVQAKSWEMIEGGAGEGEEEGVAVAVQHLSPVDLNVRSELPFNSHSIISNYIKSFQINNILLHLVHLIYKHLSD